MISAIVNAALRIRGAFVAHAKTYSVENEVLYVMRCGDVIDDYLYAMRIAENIIHVGGGAQRDVDYCKGVISALESASIDHERDVSAMREHHDSDQVASEPYMQSCARLGEMRRLMHGSMLRVISEFPKEVSSECFVAIDAQSSVIQDAVSMQFAKSGISRG